MLGNEAFDQVNPEIVLVSKTLRKKYSPLLKNYNDRSDLAVDSDLLSVWVSKNLDEFKPDQLDGSANLPAALIFTSGTEGISKTIQISHEALEHSAYAIGSRLSLAATDRWYASLSLGHVGGLALVHRAAWNGATLLVDGEFLLPLGFTQPTSINISIEPLPICTPLIFSISALVIGW